MRRIDVLTLAVDDLQRALQFYGEVLGVASRGVVGTQYEGDAINAAGAMVPFALDGEMTLCLYPRSELAKDAGVASSSPHPGEFSIGHLVASRDEVDAVLARAQAAGATLPAAARERPWGIYSGYFQDLDGHLWEIIFNPD